MLVDNMLINRFLLTSQLWNLTFQISSIRTIINIIEDNVLLFKYLRYLVRLNYKLNHNLQKKRTFLIHSYSIKSAAMKIDCIVQRLIKMQHEEKERYESHSE